MKMKETLDEKDIREFFAQNKPEPSDSEAFLAGVTARMKASEEIRIYRKEAIRRSRRLAAAAALAGILVGGGIVAALLLHPVSAPQFSTALFTAVTSYVIEWKYVFLGLIPLVTILLALIPWRHATE